MLRVVLLLRVRRRRLLRSILSWLLAVLQLLRRIRLSLWLLSVRRLLNVWRRWFLLALSLKVPLILSRLRPALMLRRLVLFGV